MAPPKRFRTPDPQIRSADALKGSEFTVWDDAVSGFGVRVRPTGAMSYVVVYRAGAGRGAPVRRANTLKGRGHAFPAFYLCSTGPRGCLRFVGAVPAVPGTDPV